MSKHESFKAGFVSVVGLPNVGKSTLVNHLIGSKLAIVSPKPQTTRSVIKGILTTGQAQIVFFDTAGIHSPKDKLGDFMVAAAKMTFEEADIIFMLVECQKPRHSDIELSRELKKTGKRVFLVINKIDRIQKDLLLPLIESYQGLMEFAEIVPVSALSGENMDRLLEITIATLPEAPALYPEDIISDQIQRDFIAEFIREKIFHYTQEEIPYSTAVVIEDMKEREEGGAYIRANIYVEKDSQKGILIGSGGSMIKKIGRDARREIQQFMGYGGVYLDLQVKVEKHWRENIKALKKFGYVQR
ncbi:MAG: GTPase Era [Proteobacteria bacterium]|jgi:GTP-binding protein Era|nr:GTPase Era [Pseudomonadota bacterium]